MTFDKKHTIQFRKTAIQKFTSVPKKFPLNLLLSVLNFVSVGGCFIEMNGSVGGSVEMKFTSIGGGSKFKVPFSPRTYENLSNILEKRPCILLWSPYI